MLALALLATLALSACFNELVPRGGWAAPVAEGDFIYVGSSNGHLLRISAETGEKDPSWGFPGPDEKIGVIYGTPRVANGVVYAAAYSCRGDQCHSNVVAVSEKSGEPVWGERTFQLDTEIVGGVAVEGGTLVFGTSRVGHDDETPGYLYALDATADAQRSLSERVGARLKWRFPVGGKIWGSPTIADGVAYFGTMDGYVYAVDISDNFADQADPAQREIWRFDAGAAVVAQPVLVGDTLYIGDFGGRFYALNLTARLNDPTGRILDRSREWVFDAGSWFWASAVVDGDTVYASALGGYVYALDTVTGAERWPEPARIEGKIIAAPTLIKVGRARSLAVPSDVEGIVFLDANTGAETGSIATNASVKARATLVGNLLYVHTRGDELMAFSVGDRTRRFCVQTPSGEPC